MRRQPIQALQVVNVGEASVEAGAEALGGLGCVLGDVAGHLLSRQLPRLVVTLAGDVADVELLAPLGVPPGFAVLAGARHPHSRDGLLQRLLENGGGEALRRWSQAAWTAALGGRVQTD